MDLNDPEIENMIPSDMRGAIDRLNTVEGKDTMPELNGLDEKWLLSKNRQVIIRIYAVYCDVFDVYGCEMK